MRARAHAHAARGRRVYLGIQSARASARHAGTSAAVRHSPARSEERNGNDFRGLRHRLSELCHKMSKLMRMGTKGPSFFQLFFSFFGASVADASSLFHLLTVPSCLVTPVFLDEFNF